MRAFIEDENGREEVDEELYIITNNRIQDMLELGE